MMGWPEFLHPMLTRRAMPETVARVLVDHAAAFRFTPGQLALLREVANARARRGRGCGCPACAGAALADPAAGPAYTSMPEDFERPAGCEQQVRHAARMFGLDPALVLAGLDASDPAQVAAWIDTVGGPLGWRHDLDWHGRLTREGRDLLAARLGQAAHPALASKRQYNRHLRPLRDLEDKRRRLAAGLELRRLVLVGRSGFACDIPLDRFAADRYAAALVTYLTARKNGRRAFALEGKENPVDGVAQMLLDRCARRPATDWPMIAAVHPRPAILARLDDRQAGELLGRWWAVMSATAEILAGIWPGEGHWRDGKVNPAEMITARGIDSYRWNTVAQAYNAARAGWLAACSARGAVELTGTFLPGKTMRVMAYDLQRWHAGDSGSAAHADTAVWAALPRPWDVIHGLASCTAADVEQACRAAGLDPAASGWTAPLADGQVAAFTPTPELVHGVAVASPLWAGMLRSAGVFSGKAAATSAAAIEAAMLRAAAEHEGQVTGELPVYLRGAYAGTTKGKPPGG